MDKIIYEQPLNEIIRVCLRLELLFKQIDHALHDCSQLGTRHTISLIINVLNILNRPDLKTKLTKELSHYHASLQRYGTAPDVDHQKLSELTNQLGEISRSLIDRTGTIGNKLRDIELLNALKLHMGNPGGGCSFDIPAYHYWLSLPPEEHKQIISNWLNSFTQIKTAISLVLELVRQHTREEDKTAINGFHQELLDPQSNLRMIRIGLDHSLKTFPEISVGRHFLSVRFFNPTIDTRPEQTNQDVLFWIAYCN